MKEKTINFVHYTDYLLIWEKSRIFAIGFERGLLKCYSFDNEKTVFIKYDVSDGIIDAGTK